MRRTLAFVAAASGLLIAPLAMADEPAAEPAAEDNAPCAGTDRDTVLTQLGKDKVTAQLQAWDLQGVELVNCAGPNIPLRMTWLSPESSTRKTGLRSELQLALEYDVAANAVIVPDPPTNEVRKAVDDTLRAADKSAVVQELAAAATAAEATLWGRSAPDGRLELFVEGWNANKPVMVFVGKELQEIALDTAVEIPSSVQVTAFKGVSQAIEHNGEVCPAPAAYRATHGDDGSWNFAFSHAKGACKGDWVLTIARDASVTWEKQ